MAAGSLCYGVRAHHRCCDNGQTDASALQQDFASVPNFCAGLDGLFEVLQLVCRPCIVPETVLACMPLEERFPTSTMSKPCPANHIVTLYESGKTTLRFACCNAGIL